MPYTYRLSSFLLVLCLLSGCTGNFKSAVDSVKAAIESNNKDSKITSDYIKSIPYASNLVVINESKPILLILSAVDKNPTNGDTQLTWLSADRGSITTENGRIIHTTGFASENLEKLSSAKMTLPSLDSEETWTAIYDWSPGYHYNFSASIQSKNHGFETISTDLWSQSASHISEKVTFKHLGATFTNHFWQVSATKDTKAHVIKSIQYLGPNMDKIKMTIMKSFLEPLKDNAEVTN